MPSQPTDLVIRPAEEADVPLILSYIRELAHFEKLADRVSATEDQLRRTLFGPRPAAEIFLAELRGNPVGFALFFQTYSTFLAQPGIYLEDLYVRPEARGQGVGRALLARVAKVARDRECGRMEWSVLDWNERAIRFYRNLGAQPLDEWTVYRLPAEAIARLAAEEAAS
jgi:GNAT superfamily N-acetyltransferase